VYCWLQAANGGSALGASHFQEELDAVKALAQWASPAGAQGSSSEQVCAAAAAAAACAHVLVGRACVCMLASVYVRVHKRLSVLMFVAARACNVPGLHHRVLGMHR